MLMNNVESDARSQPLPPKRTSGKRPVSDFHKGMSYMRRFTDRRGEAMERDVLPYKGRLYVLTNDLFIDYEVRNPPALKVAFPNRQLTGVDTSVYEALESFERYWRDFERGVTPSPELRKMPQKPPQGLRADDIYLNSDTVVERFGPDGIEWTTVTSHPFASGATRPMRFGRAAFIKMMKVATTINFRTSPVCFHYKHGRGMLVERTLSADVPDFDAESV